MSTQSRPAPRSRDRGQRLEVSAGNQLSGRRGGAREPDQAQARGNANSVFIAGGSSAIFTMCLPRYCAWPVQTRMGPLFANDFDVKAGCFSRQLGAQSKPFQSPIGDPNTRRSFTRHCGDRWMTMCGTFPAFRRDYSNVSRCQNSMLKSGFSCRHKSNQGQRSFTHLLRGWRASEADVAFFVSPGSAP